MNPFASRTTDTISLPGDPDHTITIRALAGRHLEKAQQERQFASNEYVTRMGGAAFRQQVIEARAALTEEERKRAEADPANGFDQRTVLYKGIQSWTYPESLKPIPSPKVLTAIQAAKDGDLDKSVELVLAAVEAGGFLFVIPAIDDLRDEAAAFLTRRILMLSKPSLFQTKGEQEIEQKKADGGPSVA